MKACNKEVERIDAAIFGGQLTFPSRSVRQEIPNIDFATDRLIPAP